MRQDYDSGKYTVIFDRETGELRADRNGEAWRDLSGDKLFYWMLAEHKRALEQRAELLEALKEAKAALEWCVEQGGGPVCEHESGGVVCFCKENKAINSADSAITKAEASE